MSPFARASIAFLLTAACTATAAGTDSATILFLSGPVILTTPNGETTAVKRSTSWRPNQLLRTGTTGRAQLRFPDGTLVSVSPGSDVRLDAFRYDGRGGASDLAAFTVFRGSVRFLTGADRSAGSMLRIATAAAALAAPDGELAVTAAAALQVSVGRGQVELRNDAGRLVAGEGQRVYVKDRATPPILVGTIVPAPMTPGPR